MITEQVQRPPEPAFPPEDEVVYLARLYKTREWCRRAARVTRAHDLHESADDFAGVAALCSKLMRHVKEGWAPWTRSA